MKAVLQNFDLIAEVRAHHDERSMARLGRRLMKLGEEYGESLQAYLALTGPSNYKKITPADLREELIDVCLVAMDALLHRVPGEERLTDVELNEVLIAEFKRKIKKWKKVTALVAPKKKVKSARA